VDGRLTSIQPFRNSGGACPRYRERPHLIIFFFCPERVSDHFFAFSPSSTMRRMARITIILQPQPLGPFP
jgi:hypothetical protein